MEYSGGSSTKHRGGTMGSLSDRLIPYQHVRGVACSSLCTVQSGSKKEERTHSH